MDIFTTEERLRRLEARQASNGDIVATFIAVVALLLSMVHVFGWESQLGHERLESRVSALEAGK